MMPLLAIVGGALAGAIGWKLYTENKAQPSPAPSPQPTPILPNITPPSPGPAPIPVPAPTIEPIPKFIPGVVIPGATGIYAPLTVGHEAVVPMNAVPGAALLNLPINASVAIRVDSFTNDALTGPIVSVINLGQVNRLPVPTAPVTVQRKDVTTTYAPSAQQPTILSVRK